MNNHTAHRRRANGWRRGWAGWTLAFCALTTAAMAADGGPAGTTEEHGANSPAAAPAVATAAVTKGDLHRTLPVVGEFKARQVVNLAAKVGGRVTAVLVDVGDKVSPDKPVVKIDRTYFELELAQQTAALTAAAGRIATLKEGVKTARLDIEQADLTRADAQRQFARMKALYDKPDGGEPSISKKMYDDAELRAKQAEAAYAATVQREKEAQARVAELEAAQAQIEAVIATARERLANTEVKPEFPAVVTQRLVAPGEMVTSAPATTLLELQDLEHLELLFSVPQEHAAQVQTGATVSYKVAGQPGSHQATIERILPLGDAGTRTYRCRVLVDNPAGEFRPGQLVQVRLTLETKTGVTIAPPGSLKAAAGGWEAQVRQGDKFVARPVTVGLRTLEGMEVLSGLQPGDVVAVSAE